MQAIWDDEMLAANTPPADWLWQGYLARGAFTLLTGMWKAGKTTLLSLLLSRRKTGGTLAGLPVTAGKSVVISEEGPGLWAERARRHDFGGQVCFFPQPFPGIPRPEQWQALLAGIARLHEQHGPDLVVIDPLAPFLRDENNPRHVLEALLPLADLTRRGLAVLAIHHPSKGQPPLGQAARGSGALLGHVDISLELRHPDGDPLTRRRRLVALSRYAETPRQLLLELNSDGSDYLVLPEDETDGSQATWEVLRALLANAPHKLTREELAAAWPAALDRPGSTTLRQCLDRAVARGLVAYEGTGRRRDPVRYWLPAREEVWKKDPLYELFQGRRPPVSPFPSWHDLPPGDA